MYNHHHYLIPEKKRVFQRTEAMKADRNRDTGWLATNVQAESKVSLLRCLPAPFPHVVFLITLLVTLNYTVTTFKVKRKSVCKASSYLRVLKSQQFPIHFSFNVAEITDVEKCSTAT